MITGKDRLKMTELETKLKKTEENLAKSEMFLCGCKSELKNTKAKSEIYAGAASMANDCLVDVARALAQCKTINSKALKVAIARLEEYYCCPIENIGGKKDE